MTSAPLVTLNKFEDVRGSKHCSSLLGLQSARPSMEAVRTYARVRPLGPREADQQEVVSVSGQTVRAAWCRAHHQEGRQPRADVQYCSVFSDVLPKMLEPHHYG